MIIAQVSDIHAAENNDNLARFERALSWIDFIAPDALVLTGDLIDDNWLDGYALIAAHLNKRSYPSFILPGNSDDRASMKSILNCHYWRNTCENDALHFVADIGELRLIGLDTTIPGNPSGTVGAHLPWLRGWQKI